MKRSVGLRTEIIVSSGLLVGAALLFMAFVLLRLTESRLLDLSLKLHTEQTETLCLALEHLPESDMIHVIEQFASQHHLLSWSLVDRQMTALASSPNATVQEQSNRQLRYALLGQSPQVQIQFESVLSIWPELYADRYIEISSTIRPVETLYAFQVRYSLNDVFEHLLDLAKLSLFFCLGYGLILVFAAYQLLNPSVIRPITLLTQHAKAITDGNLSQRAPESGAREIHHLGTAFNRMVDSLQNSLEEQKHHYLRLQTAHQDLKEARQQLAHSERIASIGNLTSGIAHELGNPLSATIGYLELLKIRCHDEKNIDLIQRTINETHRMDQLIKDMLDFAAPDHSASPRSCDVAQTLKLSCDMLKQQGALKDRHLQQDWPEDSGIVSLPALKLQQVLVNLILNARDATETHGTISLSADKDGDYCIIKVCDDGHGIAQENIATIFDPFYTTKPPGAGRGLGLYVSYCLINDAHGKIQVSSTSGEGTCFTLSLPLIRTSES
nr:HAMP domain-containing sensor histidine kinase [uncultured Desulfuromonas sp.]